MSAVRLLVPQGELQRWHLALRTKLEAAGARVEIAGAPGPAMPLGLRLCEDLESLLYGARGGGLCAKITEGAPQVALAARDAIPLDLTGADTPALGALAPLYDGAPGAAARDAALLDGRMPRLSIARVRDDGFEILADGLPANERPWSLRAGREAIAARILTLAPTALRQIRNGELRAPARFVAGRGPAGFAVGALAGRVKARLARLTAHEGHWRVGWRPLDGAGVLERQSWGEGAWTWLADDRRRYYADPFPFEHEGRLYLFCEEYPYATGKAVISVAAVDGAGRIETPRIVLEADCHLSYPLVFRHAGEIWMMPESSSGDRLDLYRAERFPDRWTLDRTLIEGLAISDATPFEADGRWWMTATVTEDGGSSWDCLSLFAAPDPLGPWTRCGDAPVLVDASCARPAGLVQSIGGALWRPAQDCVGGYGAGLALCRIDHVSAEAFRQTVAMRLRPPPGAPPDGVHTLNLGGGFEFIDAVGPQQKGGI